MGAMADTGDSDFLPWELRSLPERDHIFPLQTQLGVSYPGLEYVS